MDIDPHLTRVETNGISLRVAKAGPDDGRLVILLHGFPEFWYGWRHQIGPLAEVGFRVVAPDQRGYGGSEKPPGVASYGIDTLANDVAGLIEAEGRSSACLVGHDWGGVVAFWTAMRHPGRVERLAILNAPHPATFRRYVLRHPAQILKSWYVFTFQLPRLPEALLRRWNWRGLVRGMQSTSRPGTFNNDELNRYREAWSEPGAITTMIHWYRANAFRLPKPPDPIVRQPTLLIWGARDRFLSPGLAQAALDGCAHGRLVKLEEATHWVQHEEPERVNELLGEFLAE